MTTGCCAVSVVLSTRNRAHLLGAALDHLLNQCSSSPAYELIVVDNNSTDGTRALIERRREGSDTPLRYVFEPQRGLSYARNAGIRAATSDIVAFTDDDVRVGNDWVGAIKEAFDAHPNVDCVGGRTLPLWPSEPPTWLTRLHWVGPLALQDYGSQPIIVDARRALCLAGANLAFRNRVFTRIGAFAPEYLRSQDMEFMLRFWRSHGRAMYVPAMRVYAAVQADRLTKAYHRRWHARVGRSNARMALEELTAPSGAIRATVPRLKRAFGVPTFAVRLLVREAWGWLRESARRHESEAFWHELQVRALVGYIRESRARWTGPRWQPRADSEQAQAMDAKPRSAPDDLASRV